jgi:hypothetical protein
MPDLTNRRFGRLRVLRRGSRSRPKRPYWLCICSCGIEKQVRSDSLTSGAVRSCGCLWRSVMSEQGIHHKPGDRFGRLRIVRQAGVAKKRGRVYLCRCDCGRRVKVQARHLRNGETQSCGCLYRDSRSRANFRHGQSPAKNANPVYDAFYRQRSWCRNSFDRQARYYHDRGIEFRFDTFQDFYREVGNKPGPDCWLVRINRDGHFEPGNLHWISVKRHRKRRKRKQQLK